MNETRRLAEFVCNTSYEDLPTAVVEAVRIYILDNLATGVAGAITPWSDIVADLAQETSIGACTVFGRSWTTSPAYAALVNGVCIGGFEIDHLYSPGSCHPSAAVFPAALALAEQSHAGGKALLTAVALGYEAICRVAAAATRAVEDERGFHGPGTNAPIGAAFAAGRVLNFPVETVINAVGIAGSSGAGLLEFHREGAMTKRLHLGRGSQLGLESALLAQRGFTGPSTVIEGEHGFLHVYSPSPKPELVLKDLGERYLILDMTLKSYPCHISFHSVIDAIQAFRASHPFTAEDVEAVSIVSTNRMMEARYTSERAPTTMMGAQYSLPWSAAVALFKDVGAPADWTESDFTNPQIKRIAGSIALREEPPQNPDSLAEITLTIRGEQHSLTATDWKGAPTNPYSFDEMAAKFGRYAGAQLTASTVDEVIQRVANLEDLDDVGDLTHLLAAK